MKASWAPHSSTPTVQRPSFRGWRKALQGLERPMSAVEDRPGSTAFHCDSPGATFKIMDGWPWNSGRRWMESRKREKKKLPISSESATAPIVPNAHTSPSRSHGWGELRNPTDEKKPTEGNPPRRSNSRWALGLGGWTASSACQASPVGVAPSRDSVGLDSRRPISTILSMIVASWWRG